MQAFFFPECDSSYIYKPFPCIETPQFLPGKVRALVENLVGKLFFNVCCSPQEPRVVIMHQEGNSVFAEKRVTVNITPLMPK